MLKLRARGRGANYSIGRAIIESALGYAFTGDWPARLWARVPGATEVRRLDYELPLLPAGAPPLRIGFISDIHLGPTTPRATVAAGFALLRDAAPDVLFLGGDYVFMEVTEQKALTLARYVAEVPATTKLAVLGNHDLWDRHKLLEHALEECGVELLVNRATNLPAPHDGIAVVGLDDPWTGTPDPAAAFATCAEADARIVLCHAPEALPSLQDRDVALMMCGHTHGGQIKFGSRPVYVHGQVGKRRWAGLHQVNGTTLCVSRGIGGIEIPMRINAEPDVVVVTLTSAR